MHSGMHWLGVVSFVLVSMPALSQTDRPAGLTVAPNAPATQNEARPAQGGGSPANICQELVAFAEQQAAKSANVPTQGQPPGAQGQQSSKPAPNAPPPGTGQSAPAVDRPQHSSGQSAPIPQEPKQAESGISVEQARALASSNDLAGCQETTKRLRKAGVALPPGLLALGALRRDLLERSKPN